MRAPRSLVTLMTAGLISGLIGLASPAAFAEEAPASLSEQQTQVTATSDEDAGSTLSEGSRSTQPPPMTGPHVQGNRTVPTYKYDQAIRESIMINTDMDGDRNGKKDVLRLDIIRPAESEGKGVKVPTIVEPSPYYGNTGRGPEKEDKKYDSAGNLVKMPFFYDNYFVPRGYAVVGLDTAGTGKSTGCNDTGGSLDVKSVVAVVDWLNGRTTATYAKDGKPAVASWANGNTAMIGKSYDGTLANAAAATGVQGLRTIVSLSSISSWYDYTRANGIVTKPGYTQWLANALTNNASGCRSVHQSLANREDDASANYNDFWAERDYLRDMSKYTAATWLVHGVEDSNVSPVNSDKLFAALGKAGVARRMWLTQAEHDDPFDIRRKEWVEELHSWFDYWLSGLASDAPQRPLVQAQQDSTEWTTSTSWPAQSAAIPFGTGGLGAAGSGTVTLRDTTSRDENAVVSGGKTTDNYAVFRTGPLTKNVRISGSPTLTVKVRSQSSTVPLSARLVNYGSTSRFSKITSAQDEDCWGDATPQDDGCYHKRSVTMTPSSHRIIGRGWLDAAHSQDLAKPKPLVRGEWREVTIPLMALDQVVKSGNRLGLVLQLSDACWTANRGTSSSAEFDLTSARLNLPTADASAIHP